MRYIASTAYFVATITLAFFLSNIALSPQFEVVAQVKRSHPTNKTETFKPEAKALPFEDYNQCPNFQMPIINIPITTEGLKMVVKPNEEIDYKLTIIDPCLPNPTTNNNQTLDKILTTPVPKKPLE